MKNAAKSLFVVMLVSSVTFGTTILHYDFVENHDPFCDKTTQSYHSQPQRLKHQFSVIQTTSLKDLKEKLKARGIDCRQVAYGK